MQKVLISMFHLSLRHSMLIQFKLTIQALVVDSGNDCYIQRVGGYRDSSLERSNVSSSNTPFVEPAKVRNKWPTLDDQP